MSIAAADSIDWQGTIVGVQPRIRLTRSFDQSSHTYLGFLLLVDGSVGSETRVFSLGVGAALHAKHLFECGDVISGQARLPSEPRLEPAELYKVSRVRIHKPAERARSEPPPWTGVPPALTVYRERRHRRLAARTFETRCTSCIWGARMSVEMIIDQWKPDQRRYRVETFCYGPKSCPIHRSGPPRTVPGRKGMSWTEEDWVDEDATSHRGPDD